MAEVTDNKNEWNFENFTPLEEARQQQQIQTTAEVVKEEPELEGGKKEDEQGKQDEGIVVESVVDALKEDKPEFDLSKFLEEKTGGKFNKWEDIEAKLTEQPKTKKVNLSEFLKDKEELIESYYANKSFLKSLNSMPTEQVVKAYIKEQIPDLSETELDRLYQKRYGVDESQFEYDELELSIAKKEQAAKLSSVKNEAIQFFTKRGENIQLPEFELNEGSVQPDGNLRELDTKTVKEVSDFVDDLLKSNNSFGSYEIPVEYNNKEMQVKINSKIKFDTKAISNIEEKIADYPDLVFQQLFLKNGEFDKKAFSSFVYKGMYADKLVAASLSEGFNKGYLQKTMENKNFKPKNGVAPTNQPMQTAEADEFNDWLWGKK